MPLVPATTGCVASAKPRTAAVIRATPAAVAPSRRRMPLAAAAQAENAQQERGEEDLGAHGDQRGRHDGELLLGQAAEAAVDPDSHDHGSEDEAGGADGPTEQQPMLE